MYELYQYQALPLSAKVQISRQRIRQWYEHYNGDVYVSFSGGKDSTVLLKLVRELYTDVPAVFVDTGLEYPEVRRFAMEQKNVTVIRPKINFRAVIERYGYPLIGKDASKKIRESRVIGNNKVSRIRMLGKLMFNGEKSEYNLDKYLPIATDLPVVVGDQCCDVMKKAPAKRFRKETNLFPILGTLAEESRIRTHEWCSNGCNSFDGKNPTSKPMSVWKEQDVLQYILDNDLEIASVYGDLVYTDADGMEYDARTGLGCGQLKCSGCYRTGCVFCAFGAHLDRDPRFVRLKKTHPRLYKYCIDGGQWVDNPKYVDGLPEYDGEWKNWNPKKIWMPTVDGLGMGKVFDMMAEVMGREMIKY